ncbi:hypothetical protein AOL_s00173g39 [Orbilia oligospora ATCC 24927]|uniref:F-box domain-containing protein n=1 Tax=Arthrobotrys oligospora (strain ATCC 24927 / CBS 115.81 / DSM 1491) TaxID=756982 RepID=G1XNM1_ARTOA|nr:hypothetical protein AOL_s00173g39 [Orbilia oligospora ATCC 24927]EGX44938.1 hypothetical protein AOL_s00173g39 [Orbilia oligospora ATCC 24927]
MEVVQFLLRPEDSTIVVENVDIRVNDNPPTAPFASLPTEIWLIILDYLDDFSALSFALTSRGFYNTASDRLQSIICPLAELGCWAGRPLVRAGISLDTEEEYSGGSAEMDEAGGNYLMAVIESKMLGLRERGYHTIYDSDDPGKLEILRSISRDNYIPPVIRRYVSAVLSNTEYENMFQEGKQYIIRNLDKKEYVTFPTGRLERITIRPRGVFDDTLVQAPHPAENFIEAITWTPAIKTDCRGLEKGAWAGNRIDLVLDRREGLDGWKQLQS